VAAAIGVGVTGGAVAVGDGWEPVVGAIGAAVGCCATAVADSMAGVAVAAVAVGESAAGAAMPGASSEDPPPHATAAIATVTPINDTVTLDLLNDIACPRPRIRRTWPLVRKMV
jgi:hypothetical protein